MMIACLLSPRKYETTAVAASSPSTALRFRTGQPIGGGVEPPQHIRKWSRSNPCGGHRRRSRGLEQPGPKLPMFGRSCSLA